GVGRRQVERAVGEPRAGLERRAAVAGDELPRDEIRMVLELRDDDLVAPREGPPDRLRDEAEAVRGAAGEDDFLAARRADEPLDRIARQLVELRRLLAQGVDRPGDGGGGPRPGGGC